ncbi:MAG: PEGA domain-containing protein, partial [Deltaproteobacteria bacterium]|nr:PEGA domain-containing protein [Deltaproteobacteria bacterium]
MRNEQLYSRKQNMPPGVKTICVLGLLLLVQSLSIAALANDKGEAQQHFKTGSALYLAEDYKAAAAEFKTSVSLFPTKNGFFNLANCYKALHRYGDALKTLEQLEEELGHEMDAVLRAKVEQLEQKIRELVATVTIRVNHSGASIALDGRVIGTSPLEEPLIVGPGEHEIQVSLEGYETASRSISLASREEQQESFQLEPIKCELTINANIQGARVLLDGKEIGETPLGKPLFVEPGKHIVKIVQTGYEEASLDITLTPGEKSTVNLSLVEIPSTSKEPAPAIDPSDTTSENKKRLSPLFWVGLSGTLLAGAATGVFWGVAGSENGDLDRKNGGIISLNDSDVLGTDY